MKTLKQLSTKKILYTVALLLISVYLLSCQAVTVKPQDRTDVGTRSVVDYDPYTINMVIPANSGEPSNSYIATLRNSSGASMAVKTIELVGPNSDNLTLELNGRNGCQLTTDATKKTLANNETCTIGVKFHDSMLLGKYEQNRIIVTFSRYVDSVLEDYEVVVGIRATAVISRDDFQMLTATNSKVVLDESFGTVSIGDGSTANLRRYAVRNTSGQSFNLKFNSSNPEVFKFSEVLPDDSKTLKFSEASSDNSSSVDGCKLVGQTLDNNSSCLIGIRFYPRQVDPETSIITISSANDEPLAVSLFNGRGAVSDPAPIKNEVFVIDKHYIKYQFPTSVGITSTEEHSIKIKNVYKPTGPGDPYYSAMPFKITHLEQSVFTFSGTCATMTAIPTGGECTLKLAFRPLEVKKYSNPITISYRDNYEKYESVIVVLSEGRSADKLKDIEIFIARSNDDAIPPSTEFKPIEETSLPLKFENNEISTISTISYYLRLKNITSQKVFFKDILETSKTTDSFNAYAKTNLDTPTMCGASIEAGFECYIKIKTSPNSIGENAANYTITAGDGVYTLPLLTEVVDRIIKPDGRNFKLNKHKVNFLDTPLDKTSTQTITITNIKDGTKDVNIELPQNEPGVFDATTTCQPGLASKNSCDITIVFRPNSLTPVNDSIKVDGQVVSLLGKGIAPTTLDTQTISPSVSISDKFHNFGISPVGTTSEVFLTTVTVTSSTTFLLEQPSANFTYIRDFSSCLPDAANKIALIFTPPESSSSCVLAYAFTPTTSGKLAGVVRLINQTDSKAVEVELSGESYYKPKSANFGYLFATGVKTESILYANDGRVPVKITGTTLTVTEVTAAGVESTASQNVMSIAANACKGKIIVPGESCKISIRYSSASSDKRFIGKVALSISDLDKPAQDLNFMLLATSSTGLFVPVKAWSTAGSTHKSSDGQTMTSYNGEIYSLGGSLLDKDDNNALWRYNPNHNTWSKLAEPRQPELSPHAGYVKPNDINLGPRAVIYDGSLRNVYMGTYNGQLLVAGGFLVSELPYFNNNTNVSAAFAKHFKYGKINLVSLYNFNDRSDPTGAWSAYLTTMELYTPNASSADNRADRVFAATTMYGNNLVITGGYSTPYGAYASGQMVEDSKVYVNANDNTIGYRLRDNNKRFTALRSIEATRIGASLTAAENLLFFQGGAAALPQSNNYDGGSPFILFKPFITQGHLTHTFTTQSGDVATHTGSAASSHSHSVAAKKSNGTNKGQLWFVGGNYKRPKIATITVNEPNNLPGTKVSVVWSQTNFDIVNQPTVVVHDNTVWIHSGDMMYVYFD